jgi:hypothetical protein
MGVALLFTHAAHAVDPPSYSDGFEAASISTFWTQNNQNTTTTLQSTTVHGGAKAVRFSASGGGQKEAQLTHVFTQQQYGRMSVWVRDSKEYIYFSFVAYNGASPVGGIGVQDWDGSAYYSTTAKTSFARTVGWHQFTVEFSSTGYRALIDGQQVATGAATHFNKVVLSMSGPASGTIYYDDFTFESWLTPEIEVELPQGAALADGGSWNGGIAIVGEPQTIPLVVRNTGEGHLLNLAASLEEGSGTSFALTIPPGSTVAPGAQSIFSLSVAPQTGGGKSATLHLTSNDGDESSYDIQLSVEALSTTQDSDLDGMNDVGEYKLAALGFDRAISQSAMVAAYFAAANSNGLFTADQMRAVHLPAPVLSRNPATGVFTLTMALQQSPDLQSFQPMTVSPSNVFVNEAGKLEIRFTPSGNAAFYRVSAD